LLLFSLIINILTPVVLLSKYKKITLYFLFFYYFGINYLNYIMGTNQSIENFIIKAYPDVLMLSLVLRLFIMTTRGDNTNNKKKGVDKLFFVCIFVSMIYVIYSMAKDNSISRIILDWRDTVAPVLIMYLMVRTNVINFDDGDRILHFIALMVVGNSIIAIIDYYNFNGIAESSWRYDFLIDLNLKTDSDYESRMVVYQIVRNGNLRSSGLFVSALQYSYIAGMFCFYFYLKLLNSLKWLNFSGLALSLISMIICLAGVYVSQVRTAFLIIIFNILFYHLCLSYKNNFSFKPKLTMSLAVICSVVMFYAIYYLGESADASSYGRLAQYAIMISDFNPLGAGLGAYKGLFDSFYVYIILTLGAPSIYFIYFFVKRYIYIFSRKNIEIDKKYIPFVGVCFTAFPVMMLAMSFQHVAGSIYYTLNFLTFFISMRYLTNVSVK
ncbi:hypothetical protein, partial [Klebsiella pneumoniae]